jgi:hypothetical protein
MADRGAPVCCDGGGSGGGGGYVMQVGAAAKSASAAVNDLERFGHRTGVTGLWNAGPGGQHGGGGDLPMAPVCRYDVQGVDSGAPGRQLACPGGGRSIRISIL